MNNNQKHEYIYNKTGIEPRWWSDGVTDGTNYMADIMHAVEIYEGFDHSFSTPHYPAEQLWEMLPCEIEIEDYKERFSTDFMEDRNFKLVHNKYFIAYEDTDWQLPRQYFLKKIKSSDLHTALIDMVLWCIENGYIASRACEAKGKDDE